jgi:signal transduction histidine kinase
MRRSLRFRLTVSTVGVLAVVMVALLLVLQAVFARALRQQFDGRLLGDAAAVAGMAEDGGAEGQGAFEYESLPEFESADRPAYFEAWLDDGRVLARSPSLGARDLPRSPGRAAAPTLADVVLPDARAGRAVQLRQPLRFEDASPSASPSSGPPPRVSPRFVTVVVARGSEEVTQTLTSLRHWLLALALAGLAGASVAALLAVSRGLRPARVLAAQLADLDVTHLDGALSADDLPEELTPIVAKMNQLLARLRRSFERERRFTADVSHELRTPLAALRTTFEVTLTRDRTATEYRDAIQRATPVVLQMQQLCENLLALSRLDAGAAAVARHRVVDLHALVRDCWRLFADSARQRDLTFENQLAGGPPIATDPEQMHVIVSNLLSNAAAYTATGGTIRVGPGPGETGDVVLEVGNTGPPIAEAALPHIFERFFRGDPTRSDGIHGGIGLALVRSISETLGLTVTARNTADGGVAFVVARDRRGGQGTAKGV